ncbi:hypothetical protein HPB47_016648, partial [Ixodes persulcatus]
FGRINATRPYRLPPSRSLEKRTRDRPRGSISERGREEDGSIREDAAREPPLAESGGASSVPAAAALPTGR